MGGASVREAQEEKDVMQIWKPLCLGSGDGVASHCLIPDTIGFACSTLDLVSTLQIQGGYWGDSQDTGPASDPRLHCQHPSFMVSSHESCRAVTQAPAAPSEGTSALSKNWLWP